MLKVFQDLAPSTPATQIGLLNLCTSHKSLKKKLIKASLLNRKAKSLRKLLLLSTNLKTWNRIQEKMLQRELFTTTSTISLIIKKKSVILLNGSKYSFVLAKISKLKTLSPLTSNHPKSLNLPQVSLGSSSDLMNKDKSRLSYLSLN